MKKIISILLMLSFLIMLTACKDNKGVFLPSDDTVGGFSKIEVNDNAAKVKEEKTLSPFNRLESGLYDNYQVVTSGILYLKFDVPSSWNVNVVNARHIEIDVPENDLYIPGTSFNLIANLSTDSLYNSDPFSYNKIFENDLKGLFYLLEGKEYYEIYNDNAVTESYVDDDIGNDLIVGCNYFNDTHLFDRTKRAPQNSYDSYHYGILWHEDLPIHLRAVTNEGNEYIRLILKDIVSSFREYEYETGSLIEARFDNVKVDLPSCFIETKSNGKVAYKCPDNSDTPYAGCLVVESEFTYDFSNFDSETFVPEVYEGIKGRFFPPNLFTSTIYPDMENPYTLYNAKGEELYMVYINANYFRKGLGKAELIDSDGYTTIMTYIIKGAGNKYYSISTSVLPCQLIPIDNFMTLFNQTLTLK